MWPLHYNDVQYRYYGYTLGPSLVFLMVWIHFNFVSSVHLKKKFGVFLINIEYQDVSMTVCHGTKKNMDQNRIGKKINQFYVL